MSGTLEAEEGPGGATERIAAVLADQHRDDIAGLLVDALDKRFRGGLDVSLVLLEAKALASLRGYGPEHE